VIINGSDGYELKVPKLGRGRRGNFDRNVARGTFGGPRFPCGNEANGDFKHLVEDPMIVGVIKDLGERGRYIFRDGSAVRAVPGGWEVA